MLEAKQPRGFLIACLILFALAGPLAAQTSGDNSGVLSYGNARVKFDASKWTAEAMDEPGNWALKRLGGEAFARVSVVRFEIALNTLVDYSLQRLRARDQDVRILSQENRTIGGIPARVVRFDAAYQGVPFTGVGCFYGGRLGAVEIITGAPRAVFNEYRSDFNELCEGLEMSQSGKSEDTAGGAMAEGRSAPSDNHSVSNQPAPPSPPAVFILANGDRIESSKYTLTAKSVTVEQGETPRTIPLSAINIDATLAANRARGLDLKIPTSKNQIMLGF